MPSGLFFHRVRQRRGLLPHRPVSRLARTQTHRKGTPHMTRSPVPLVGAVLLLCLAGPSLRAEPAWTFSLTSPDTTIFADSGTSGLSLFPSSGHGSGTSDIVAANLQAISTAPANTPDPFTGKGYTLNLHLVDDASGASGDLK